MPAIATYLACVVSRWAPWEGKRQWGSLRISGFIGVLAIVASSTIALAADLSMPAPETPPPPIEIGSGWYLRGDIGYKMYNTPSAHFDVAGYGNMIDENITDTCSRAGLRLPLRQTISGPT